MSNITKLINVKIAIGIILGISIVIWCLILLLIGTDLSLDWKAFKHLSTVLTIDVFLFGIFVKWIWRWKRLQGWLVPFPDLNGTWKGNIKCITENTNTYSKKDIEVSLIIRQTFLNVSCMFKTEESQSVSYSASFLVHPEMGQKQLVYSYYNKPKASVRKRSIPHDGTVLLNIIQNGKLVKLEGEYWTSRASTGEIILQRDNDI